MKQGRERGAVTEQAPGTVISTAGACYWYNDRAPSDLRLLLDWPR